MPVRAATRTSDPWSGPGPASARHAADREHKAIYCRQQAAELSPGRLPLRAWARAAGAGGQMSQGTALNVSEPATLPDLFSGRRQSGRGRHGCAPLFLAGSGAMRTRSASALTCMMMSGLDIPYPKAGARVAQQRRELIFHGPVRDRSGCRHSPGTRPGRDSRRTSDPGSGAAALAGAVASVPGSAPR